MIIEELTPSANREWDAYVEAHPDANCYHLRAWKTAAESAYGIEAPFLVARESGGGPVRGVLPLFVIRAGPGSAYLTTGLFGAYGPVLAVFCAASTARLWPGGWSDSRKATSAVVSGGLRFLPYAGMLPPPCSTCRMS